MCSQLKVAFFKLRHFWLFYAGIVWMAGLGFSYGYIKLADVGCDIHDAFAQTNCDTSFMFIIALIAAWFIGNDFSNRTIHHEIVLGYSRWSVLIVRELPVYLSAILLHSTYIIFTMAGVGMKTGFSGSMFKMQDVFWYVTILMQLIALQSIIVFLSFICEKAPVAIAVVVCFTFIMCNVLRNYFDEGIFTKSCFYFVQDPVNETMLLTGALSAVTFVVMLVFTYFVFRKKEIR